MHLSKITVFKNFLFLFILSFLITSCEPEDVPVDEGISKNQLDSKIGTTGNQETPPVEKKP